MAWMIPDSIPKKASEGEKKVFAILRDCLPDDFYVYYEPVIDGVHPDFLILSPTFGLLVLEVKGWFPGTILKADNNFFHVEWKHGGTKHVEVHKSPLQQTNNYFWTIVDKLKEFPILLQHEGDYAGKLAFTVGQGVVMSNITEVQSKNHNLYTLLPQPQVAYKDEYLEWHDYSEHALIKRLREMFKVKFSFPALTEDQFSTIRGVLHPEMIVRQEKATQNSVQEGAVLIPGSVIIKSLDAKQEQEARKLGDGHRLITGVAGSGKTIILLARARQLAQQENKRVLLLCYNITLAAYLRSQLSDQDNQKSKVEVVHFHDWAKSILKSLPNVKAVKESGQDYDEVMGEDLLVAINNLCSESKWDSILIDEAHIFDPSWFTCCVQALKSPEDGDLLIVYDGNQKLYKRSSFTWSSVGIKARGRTKRLNNNYRNTKQILDAAWSIIQPIQENRDETDDIAANIVEPKSALRDGVLPILHLKQSESTCERLEVIKTIEQLCAAGTEPKDIAILYRYNKNNQHLEQLISELQEKGLGAYWVTEDNDSKCSYSSKIDGVRILTTQSSLGLEFKAVIIIKLEQFASCCDNDVESLSLARRQFYVAMTRAQHELHLFGREGMMLTNELKNFELFDVTYF